MGDLVWGVALYEHANIDKGTTLLNVAGYEFYIDPSVEQDVANATLDYRDGRFMLLRP